MADFFNFLLDIGYKEDRIARLNFRWDHIIKPFQGDIRGARVLDLASADGRWPYAFAAAGAREVVAVEGRPEIAARFRNYPEDDYRKKVSLSSGDLFEFCRNLIATNQEFDIVGILGVFYHIMSHYELLLLAQKLRPKLILLDTELLQAKVPIIRFWKERVAGIGNTTAYLDDQEMAPVGLASIPALELMANSLGYTLHAVSWDDVPKSESEPVQDYFRDAPRRRYTYALRLAQRPAL